MTTGLFRELSISHLSNIYFLRVSHVTDIILCSGDPAMNRADKLPSLIEEDEGQKTHKEANRKIAWRPGVPGRDFG